VIEVLVPIFPGLGFREDPLYGVITVDVTPDRLEPLQKVVELLDVPRDAAELRVSLVWGKKSTFRAPLPRELRGVEGPLRERFGYERYELENRYFLPALERGKGKIEIYPDYTLEYALDRVEPASGEADVRLDVSRWSIFGERLASILQTDLRVSVGRPTVVGAVPMPPDRNVFQGFDQRRYPAATARALILVIEVSIPDEAPPPRAASVIDQFRG